MKSYFPKRAPVAPLHILSKLYDVPVGFVPPASFEAGGCYICGHRRVAVARYRIICLVLVNAHLFPLPCRAGCTVPCEGYNFSVIIFASLPSLFLQLCNISCFLQVERTFSQHSYLCTLASRGTLSCAFGVNLQV